MKNFLAITLTVIVISFASCSSSKNVVTSGRDGSSYETAIIVKSIPAEYEYVKNVCQGCQILGQSLSQYKNKPYDILTLKNADGNEVTYYFDISKFFGKGF